MERDTGSLLDLIVVALANDYEPFGVLMEEVKRSAHNRNVHFSQEAFVDALARSVANDLIQPMVYNQASGQFEPQAFKPLELTSELWHTLVFRLTKRGEARLTDLGY